SSTLGSADWSNSTILGSYSADAIRGLKARVDGGIYVSGSGTLVRTMLADRLVDELHLFVFPLALGGGQRLFANGSGATRFELTGCDVCDNGALHLSATAPPSPPKRTEFSGRSAGSHFDEARGIEVAVEREGFPDPAPPHDNEAGRIHERVLALTASAE